MVLPVVEVRGDKNGMVVDVVDAVVAVLCWFLVLLPQPLIKLCVAFLCHFVCTPKTSQTCEVKGAHPEVCVCSLLLVPNRQENAHARGWRAVAMNHRGCGGTRLTSGWAYNGAFTGDVRMAVSHIRER